MHTFLDEIRQGATPDLTVFLDQFGATLPLLHDLAGTPQEPIWHGEGDVLAHTRLVLEEIYDLLAGQAAHLAPDRRLALVLAALLHDIAKPLTTRTRLIDGQPRLVAPHHAERGRSYLAYRLLEIPLPYGVVDQVLALVGHHHDPKHMVLRDRPEYVYRCLARLVDLELLYYLELADMRGRQCEDQTQQIELIELFRLFAGSYNLWREIDPYRKWREFFDGELAGDDEETRAFVLAQAIREAEAGLIASPYEALARSFQYRAQFARLVVLCGPSGAGKSTWIGNNLPDYHIVSLDNLREEIAGDRHDQSMNGQVRRAAQEALKGHLRRHENVVWDATGLRRDFRRTVLQIGFDYQACTTLVVFHLPESELFKRNAGRKAAVPPEILRGQLDCVEWPSATEAHHLRMVR